MSTATTQQDDDLLIIADDDHSEDTIEFSFDEETPTNPAETETKATVTDSDVSEQVKTEEIVKESSDTTTEVTSEVSEPTLDAASETSDMSFDLFEDNKEDEVRVEEVSEAPENQESDFSFDLGEEETSKKEEISIESSEIQEETMEISLGDTSGDDSAITDDSATWDDSSMNDILSATIAKLEARKSHIAESKESKLKHEDEIKAQIKALEDEHASIEAELSGLDSESDKIIANIKELENMKLDPVKDHNAKRAKK